MKELSETKSKRMPRKLKATQEELINFIRTHTLSEVSQKFNISYGYASMLAKKLGVKAKIDKYREFRIDIEQLRKYAKEHKADECARYFNVPTGLVYRYCNRFKIPYLKEKPRVYTDKKCSCKRTGEARDMIVYLSEKFTNAAIGRVFGYSKERIRQILIEEEKRIKE